MGVDSVLGEDFWKDGVLTWSDFIGWSSVQTASSSELTVFTFCTEDVILCMRDFVFCVWALVSAGFDVRGCHVVFQLCGDLTCWHS